MVRKKTTKTSPWPSCDHRFRGVWWTPEKGGMWKVEVQFSSEGKRWLKTADTWEEAIQIYNKLAADESGPQCQCLLCGKQLSEIGTWRPQNRCQHNYKHILWDKGIKRWVANIYDNDKKQRRPHYFDSIQQAALAYNQEAVKSDKSGPLTCLICHKAPTSSSPPAASGGGGTSSSAAAVKAAGSKDIGTKRHLSPSSKPGSHQAPSTTKSEGKRQRVESQSAAPPPVATPSPSVTAAPPPAPSPPPAPAPSSPRLTKYRGLSQNAISLTWTATLCVSEGVTERRSGFKTAREAAECFNMWAEQYGRPHTDFPMDEEHAEGGVPQPPRHPPTPTTAASKLQAQPDEAKEDTSSKVTSDRSAAGLTAPATWPTPRRNQPPRNGSGPSIATAASNPGPARRRAVEIVGGYVEQLPALLEGEVMVMGHVVSAEASVFWERQERHWSARRKKLGGVQVPWCRILKADLSEYKLTEDVLRKKFKKYLKAGPDPKCNPDNTEQDLPEDPGVCSAIEKFRISDQDPRVGLRGQLGARVRAGCQLDIGDIIGPYRALTVTREEYDTEVKFGERVVLAPGDPPVHPLEQELLHESFGCDFEIFNKIQVECQESNKKSLPELVSSAYRYGNLTALINDPHINPLDNRSTDPMNDHKGNVVLLEFLIRDWPFVFTVATQPIDPGEELMYPYGSGFWDTIRMAWKRLGIVSP